MKKCVMLLFVLALFGLVGCASAPAPQAEANSGVDVEPAELAWQPYEDTEGGFTLQYPSDWQMEDLPDDNGGLLRRFVVRGAEGEITIHWGVGLGGACPDGYKDFVIASGETLQLCPNPQADGTNLWNLSGPLSEENGFSVFAQTNNSAPESTELVLKVLASITFK